MKTAAFATVAVLLGAATPAIAQDEAPATEEKAEALTIDSPIEALLADEAAKAVVMKHFDGQDISAHPMYDQFKGISLKALAPFSQGMITDELLEKVEADLAGGADAAADAPVETAEVVEESQS